MPDAVTQRPHGPTDRILATDIVEPRPFIAHKVVKPAVGQLRVMQESKICMRQLQRCRFERRLVARGEGDHERPRNVVRAVTGVAIRNVAEGMLNHADIVAERDEVIQGHRRHHDYEAERTSCGVAPPAG